MKRWLENIRSRLVNLLDPLPTRSRIIRPYRTARQELSTANRQKLVALSHFFATEMPLVSRLEEIFVSYLVGDGVRMIPASSDEEWNAKVEATVIQPWERSADLTTRQPFSAMQSQMALSWFRYGEAFILKTSNAQGFPRLQMIDPSRVVTPSMRDNANRDIYDGIEVNSNGQAIAYWIRDRDEQTVRRVDATQVLHLFEPERPDQVRGIPFLAPSLNTLWDLWDLQFYEMRAAKSHSLVSRVLIGRSRSTIEALEELYRAPNVADDGAKPKPDDSTAGDIITLDPGQDMRLLASERPSVATREFWNYLTSQVCSGTGIPFQLVFPEFSDRLQGTALRAQIAMFDTWCRARFRIFEDILRRIYVYILPFHRNNLFPAINPFPPDWSEVSLVPPRSIIVDVGYDSENAINEIAANLRTYEQHFGARGLSWRKQLKQRAVEDAYLSQLGLDKQRNPDS